MNLLPESTPAAAPCVPRWNAINLLMFSADTFTNAPGRSDVIGSTRCINVGKAGYLLEI